MGEQDGKSGEESPLLTGKVANINDAVLTEQRGYVYMALGAVLWSLLGFFVHIGATKYKFPVVASVFIRAVFNGSLSAAYIATHKDEVKLPTRSQTVLLLVRGTASACGCFCAFSALERLGIGTAITMFSTSPVITTLLSAVFLRELPTAVDVGALVCSFVGVVFVANPSFLVGAGAALMADGEHVAGVVYALGVALCGSTVFVVIRHMGVRVHFMLNVISPAMCMGVLALSLSDANVWAQLGGNGAGLALNVVGALCGFGGVLCAVFGLQRCRAGPAMIVRTIDVPFTFLLGYLFLGESVSAPAALGVVLVVLAAVLVGVEKVFEAQGAPRSTR